MLDTVAQFLGYLATLLLAVSLMVTNEIKFRWLNTLGCVCFIVYGAVINALPVMITNTLLLLINAWYLVKIYRSQEQFDLMVFGAEEKIAVKFLDFYETDIQKYFPDYRKRLSENDTRLLILRNMVIANVFIAEISKDGQAYVKLNYTVEKYRDYKIGKYLFKKENSFLATMGVKTIVYEIPINKAHARFLQIMKFDQTENGFKKTLLPK